MTAMLQEPAIDKQQCSQSGCDDRNISSIHRGRRCAALIVSL